MWKKILLAVAVLLVCLFGYVALQKPDYQIARSITVQAPAERVFPHVNDVKKFDVWNPWSKLDPNAKIQFSENTAGVGAFSSWDGNHNVGAGTMTVADSQPNSRVAFKLEFLKPFPGTQDAEFTFVPNAEGTVVTWSIRGKSSFIPRLFCTLMFVNMDKMMGDMFDKGLAQLKAVAEAK